MTFNTSYSSSEDRKTYIFGRIISYDLAYGNTYYIRFQSKKGISSVYIDPSFIFWIEYFKNVNLYVKIEKFNYGAHFEGYQTVVSISPHPYQELIKEYN